jgi:hypothetical protein
MTKEEIWEHITSISGLWEDGKCKECSLVEDECECLAGIIRFWLKEESNVNIT